MSLQKMAFLVPMSGVSSESPQQMLSVLWAMHFTTRRHMCGILSSIIAVNESTTSKSQAVSIRPDEHEQLGYSSILGRDRVDKLVVSSVVGQQPRESVRAMLDRHMMSKVQSVKGVMFTPSIRRCKIRQAQATLGGFYPAIQPSSAPRIIDNIAPMRNPNRI